MCKGLLFPRKPFVARCFYYPLLRIHRTNCFSIVERNSSRAFYPLYRVLGSSSLILSRDGLISCGLHSPVTRRPKLCRVFILGTRTFTRGPSSACCCDETEDFLMRSLTSVDEYSEIFYEHVPTVSMFRKWIVIQWEEDFDPFSVVDFYLLRSYFKIKCIISFSMYLLSWIINGKIVKW